MALQRNWSQESHFIGNPISSTPLYSLVAVLKNDVSNFSLPTSKHDSFDATNLDFIFSFLFHLKSYKINHNNWEI